jgi:hypothetical protein
MARKILSKSAKEHLKKASPRAISESLIGFPDRYRKKKWLLMSNRYRENCTGKYAFDLRNGARTLDHADLTHYIAASTPAHIIDGWSFFGRAIDAALRRDTYSAIHFGYYAELRAAMSLLASEGIGILSNKHPIVYADGTSREIAKQLIVGTDGARSEVTKSPFVPNSRGTRGTTHSLPGPCLQYWSTLARSKDLLDELIQPDGLPISTWLEACGSSVPARAVAQKWLKAWGIDLNSFDEDHVKRNLASYRPSEFRLPPKLETKKILHFIKDLWKLFEPSTAGRFKKMERYLLRRALNVNGRINLRQTRLEELGLPENVISEWINFLSETNNDPAPFEYAESISEIDDADCHIQVLSRAALLLFMATSGTRRLLSNAGYSSEELKFWWKKYGITRALWDSRQSGATPTDIWADVEDRLEECEQWLNTNQTEDQTLWNFRNSLPQCLHFLGAWEIIAVWGLAS